MSNSTFLGTISVNLEDISGDFPILQPEAAEQKYNCEYGEIYIGYENLSKCFIFKTSSRAIGTDAKTEQDFISFQLNIAPFLNALIKNMGDVKTLDVATSNTRATGSGTIGNFVNDHIGSPETAATLSNIKGPVGDDKQTLSMDIARYLAYQITGGLIATYDIFSNQPQVIDQIENVLQDTTKYVGTGFTFVDLSDDDDGGATGHLVYDLLQQHEEDSLSTGDASANIANWFDAIQKKHGNSTDLKWRWQTYPLTETTGTVADSVPTEYGTMVNDLEQGTKDASDFANYSWDPADPKKWEDLCGNSDDDFLISSIPIMASTDNSHVKGDSAAEINTARNEMAAIMPGHTFTMILHAKNIGKNKQETKQQGTNICGDRHYKLTFVYNGVADDDQ